MEINNIENPEECELTNVEEINFPIIAFDNPQDIKTSTNTETNSYTLILHSIKKIESF